MAMVPSGSVLHDRECISEVIPRCNWALGDAVNAVKMHPVKHTQSMPMYACAIAIVNVIFSSLIWQPVVNRDIENL
jgi:hypothetical protein